MTETQAGNLTKRNRRPEFRAGPGVQDQGATRAQQRCPSQKPQPARHIAAARQKDNRSSAAAVFLRLRRGREASWNGWRRGARRATRPGHRQTEYWNNDNEAIAMAAEWCRLRQIGGGDPSAALDGARTMRHVGRRPCTSWPPAAPPGAGPPRGLNGAPRVGGRGC